MNKKMLLSVLIIAFVGIAAAGTWANYVVSEEAGDNTLTAGILEISIGKAGGAAFSVDKIIPGQRDQIEYIKVCDWHNPTADYYLEPSNTGNVKGALYISGTEAAGIQSLMDNVDIYYSFDQNSNHPTLLTPTSTDMNKILNPSGEFGDSARVYFWYAYKNVDSSIQNNEMGQTLTSTIKFELKNPETVPGTPIE